MKNKKIDVIVLDDEVDKVICKNIRLGLKRINFTKFRGVKINVIGFKRSSELLAYLEKKRWSYVHCIFIDYTLKNPENDGEFQDPSGKELINEIKSKNPFIHLYGMTVENGLDNKQLLKFFYQSHTADKRKLMNAHECEDELQRFIKTPIKKKLKTPFWKAYKEYINQTSHSWHVPGHNKGLGLKESFYGQDFYNFFGKRVFTADHAVPKEFGSIFTQNTDNVIEKTQTKIAKSFNTGKTFFVTNGNTTANNIILLSILKPGDKVLVARSCHKSIHNAMILSGAHPTYLKSTFSKKYEVMAPPSIDEIERNLKEKGPNYYKLVIVTGCGYEGIVMDVKKVNDLCNKYGTELFVDEAWYGYSNFHPLYQGTSATNLGVPYVTQSAHKMLSALRQSAFIHINSSKIDLNYFKDIYNTFTSTSPQYQLIASMDVAVMQMRMEGFELIQKALDGVEKLKESFRASNIKNITIVEKEHLEADLEKEDFFFEKEGVQIDPLKISFDISRTGLDIKTVYNKIKEEAIVDLVKYTKNCIQILFTIGTAFDEVKIIGLLRALKTVDDLSIPVDDALDHKVEAPSISELTYKEGKLPRDYFYAKKREVVAIDELAIGKLSATLVTPYPPGIPLLLPGEKINKDHVKYLKSVIDVGHVSIHGLNDQKKIFVVCEEE